MFKIGDKMIGGGRCFVVAECGVNHNGSLKLARLLIDSAKNSGADAVKFQIYQTDKFVSKNEKTVPYQKRNGFDNQYDMLKGLELRPRDFIQLKKYADKKKIIFLATPHSCKEDVDLVAKLCPAIKIGSGSLKNFELLEYIRSKGLPVIISTGMASFSDIARVLFIFKYCRIALLQCTTEYPCPVKHVNLNAMKLLSIKGLKPYGLSDHTTSLLVPAIAVAKGACIIEKHLTLNKNSIGPDHKASLEPKEFKQMVDNIREAELSFGDGEKKPTAEELKIRDAIRSRGVNNGRTV